MFSIRVKGSENFSPFLKGGSSGVEQVVRAIRQSLDKDETKEA